LRGAFYERRLRAGAGIRVKGIKGLRSFILPESPKPLKSGVREFVRKLWIAHR